MLWVDAHPVTTGVVYLPSFGNLFASALLIDVLMSGDRSVAELTDSISVSGGSWPVNALISFKLDAF